MADLQYVAYCGLHCKLCCTMSRIPQQASALRETLSKGGWEHFGEFVMSDFRGFWADLEMLCELAETTQGCKGGCGAPDCGIRACARERGVEVCSECPEFPCERVQTLGRAYPHLIADGRRQQEIPLEAWVAEQEQRARTGFCHCDIRNPSEPLWGQDDQDSDASGVE